MGGLLTCLQCFTPMESLKDHSFWDFHRKWVRIYFGVLHVTVIVLTLFIIHCSIGRECPEDQAKLLHICQLDAENEILKIQLIKMEDNVNNALLQVVRTIQEKKEMMSQVFQMTQDMKDDLRKDFVDFHQSLILTTQLLEEEKEKTQSLQSQLQTAKEDLEIKQLKQQLSNLQQMKEQQQKEIQNLEDQLMKHKPLERSKGGLLLGPSVVLFPLLLAGLLL